MQDIHLRGSAARRYGWQTNRGLRIGTTLRRMKRLYRDAGRNSRGEWTLIEMASPYGPTGTRLPILRAFVKRGRVTSIRVWIGGAGD